MPYQRELSADLCRRRGCILSKQDPARGPVALSTGRTILHRREPNGSQFAYPAESETLEMTQAEWDEYCEIVRRPKAPKLPKPEPMRQAVLFSGMDCLPGQNDLFPTE